MAAIQLTIQVDDIANVLLSYDVLRVERSTTGLAGPYAEITRQPPEDAATLLGSTVGPFNLTGESIQVSIDDAPAVLVSFTGTNPLSIGSVVGQVNTALGATIASNENNQLRLRSLNTGTESSVQITGGSAAGLSVLGFTAGQRDIGAEQWIVMNLSMQSYEFIDNDGDLGYYYQVWFFNSTTNTSSPRSAPFLGSAQVLLANADLCLSFVNLVDLSGFPIVGQRISVYGLTQPLVVTGYAVDIARKPIIMVTDNAGHAEVHLVRGAQVKIVFEGTSYIRAITIPAQTTVDLVATAAQVPDQFDEAVLPQLPAAPRRTT